ncbi:RING-H2 finger protein ATL78-like isoform X1 [Herrania umbratica]|uniref:RING-type E3 ubiquitin transferase n=1 Tax=Herrania umbratica TaxID=108875 RepID=A0A6J0ZHS2_9ROSI|nr:RING-H2 finger protein ATL78-like isoform X1 [Herrania umbratica]
MDSAPSTSFQDFLGNFHSRKLLPYKPPSQPSVTAAPPPYSQNANLDENVFMVLSVLLCGLICSLGLNFIVRCAFSCSARAASESNDNPSAGTVNRGIEKEALKTFPVVNYLAEMKLPGLDTECVICLSEFVPGIFWLKHVKKSLGVTKLAHQNLFFQLKRTL